MNHLLVYEMPACVFHELFFRVAVRPYNEQIMIIF